jgi:rod shape determining protein RodA
MNRRIWQHYDTVLLAALLLLLIYGVAIIYSASHAIDRVRDSAVRQAVFAALGLLAGLAITAIDYRLLDAFSIPLYVLVVVLLLAVFVIGQITFNAQRSIDLGIVDLQPSELSKPLLIVVLAAFLARREEKAGNHLLTLLLSALLVGVPVVLIYLEPDLGTSLVLAFVWLAMIFASGIPLLYVGLVLGGGLVAVPFFWLTMEDYMRRRVVTFLNPASDPQSYYNIQQALYAIGSGGWFGKGYLKGTQSQLHFLLVQHTDFVFAVMVEELGIAGALFLFVLLIAVLMRTLHAARLARDTFGRLLCIGVAAWVFVQCVVNIGMNLNLLPVTGLPLPFISYGGSSLLTLLAAMGLVQSVRLRHRKIEF